MIYVIDEMNNAQNGSILDEMFRMRYKVAVEHWGWNVPGVGSGIDKDQFDTNSTTHFLKIDDAGNVHGCARLISTMEPHMLSELFSDVCDRSGVPQAPDTYEFSRFFVDKILMTRRDYIQTGYELLAAIAEWCHINDVRRLSWYAFQVTYGLALPLWQTAPLGSPQTHEGDQSVYVPAISTIDEGAVLRTKEKAGVRGAAFMRVQDIGASLASRASRAA